MWTPVGNSTVGGYNFQLPGYGRLYLGIGAISNGLFTGEIICDPSFNMYCGAGGRARLCGDSVSCVYTYADSSDGGYGDIAHVINLNVTSLVRKW